jgi:hypothetical protein
MSKLIQFVICYSVTPYFDMAIIKTLEIHMRSSAGVNAINILSVLRLKQNNLKPPTLPII